MLTSQQVCRKNFRSSLLFWPSYSRLTRCYASRTRQSGSDTPSSADESRPERPHQVRKTRVKVKDLPTAYTLPDGSIASPLEEWHSSASASVTKVKQQISDSRDFHDSDQTETSSLVVQRPKRARTRKLKSAVTKTPLVELSSSIGHQYPRTGLAREILENLEKFPHCLLLTRVGQFYESYFDQAEEIARLLSIKLTSRRWGGQDVAMCGFPIMHLDKSIKVLVQSNKRFVAMCEEFPIYSGLGVKEFERRVTRVITPGTLIDESFLNQYENNYILAVSPSEAGDKFGLAWMDVSTGEFYSKTSDYPSLRDDITRIGPHEIVLDKSHERDTPPKFFMAFSNLKSVISYVAQGHMGLRVSRLREDPFLSDAQSPIPDEITHIDNETPPSIYTPQESSAIDLLTSYLRANLLENMPPLQLPNREDMESRMQIDSHTIDALEIRESLSGGGKRGSLLSVIKRTVTDSGTRLLARWLCSPSTSLTEINARQSLVAFFCDRPHLRADLLSFLRKAEDAGRLVQKFLLGRGDSSHLHLLGTTMKLWANIQLRIQEERQLEAQNKTGFHSEQWKSLDALVNRMADMSILSQRISISILPYTEQEDNDANLEISNEESSIRGPPKLRFNPGFSDTLSNASQELERLLKEKLALERRLQHEFAAPSLTLRSSPGQGMYIHLAKSPKHQKLLNEDARFVLISHSNSTRSYFFQEWTLLGGKIFEASVSVTAAEKDAFEVLRNEVNGHAAVLRKNARILDELDVTLSFSSLATELNFVRPTLCEHPVYNVVDGRHATVELGLLTSGRVFTCNSLNLSPESQLHVITGPNMGGKSTILRQTALTAILAQTGSFVPASDAQIGIVDKVFSRIGAKDDLFHDRSTFMVEMLETAEILSKATSRSLVIMDEVGRGTTTTDGLAIAFATVQHLVTKNKARTLFATHFHELADLLGCSVSQNGTGVFENVSFFCTDVNDTEDGHFAYSYRLRPGVNRDSHGLKVAQLAGMPEHAVDVARNTLKLLRSQKLDPLSSVRLQNLGQAMAS